MRIVLLSALSVCIGCGGDVGSTGVASDPPLERVTVEGDEAVFRALSTIISVTENASNSEAQPGYRMLVSVDVGPLDAATGTVPGLSLSLQGEPMPLIDANPDRPAMPGEVKPRVFYQNLPSGRPSDEVLHFVFEYRGSRLRYDLALAQRIAIEFPLSAVSASQRELTLLWRPELPVADTTIDLTTTHYSENPVTIGQCKVRYSATRQETSRATFTLELDPFEYALGPPCVGRASIINRQSRVVSAPLESLRIDTSQYVTTEFTVNP